MALTPAEAFPLYLRDTGMSFATATCWGFNFIISFTWPALLQAFTPQGAFSWYAGWNLFATVYTYFLLPETKVGLRPRSSSVSSSASCPSSLCPHPKRLRQRSDATDADPRT